MKTVDYIYHFTKDIDVLKVILDLGFMPSYAKETLSNRNILVPMVSFSNILLRDVGDGEVINYGNFAVGFTRQWGITSGLNPVIYTYEDGLLEKNIQKYLDNAIFLSSINTFRQFFERLSKDPQEPPWSEQFELTNTSKEVYSILDFLSKNYSEEYNAPLFEMIASYAKTIGDATLPIISLTKRHEVFSLKGQKFIAYNDREWRKNYPNLGFLFETNAGDAEIQEDYATWIGANKPHFPQDEHRLRFDPEDIKIVVVQCGEQIEMITNFLKQRFSDERITSLLKSKSIMIGTLETLSEIGI
jgi:hypothetical protein